MATRRVMVGDQEIEIPEFNFKIIIYKELNNGGFDVKYSKQRLRSGPFFSRYAE